VPRIRGWVFVPWTVEMAKTDIAALLGLGAALFIAIGDVMHQRSAHEVTDESVGHLQLFIRLLTDRGWWLGSLVAAAGFILQAAALALGSVLLVQALLVTSLLFALPVNARLHHRGLTRWDGTWAALLAASVVVIVIVGNPTAGSPRASLATWAVAAGVLGAVILTCIVGAGLTNGPVSAVLLAVVSGSFWGIFAVLTKGVVHLFGEGVEPLLRSPELYAWAVFALAGTAYQQSSFRAGALTASLPTMAISEPIVASVLSVFVLGETMRPGGAGWIFLVVAVVATVVSVAALARGEAGMATAEIDATRTTSAA
jgi:drug/metabolite transporter (DMT)-like permease